jgi:potassium voltage-gated channel Eag-related subfamily H protein 7
LILIFFRGKIILINQFLVRKKIPKPFHKKVKRYFRYIVEDKRQFKLEENEVMELLNENLKIELIVHLNGKMLHDSDLFRFFSLSFLSELTFILKRETFTIEQKIFDEDTFGDRLHYITKGNVVLVHKKSATFIAEVSIESFIGEVSFFTGRPRKASARSKSFTEVLTL